MISPSHLNKNKGLTTHTTQLTTYQDAFPCLLLKEICDLNLVAKYLQTPIPLLHAHILSYDESDEAQVMM